MSDVIVRRAARADVRDAALWYESQRPGLGSELTLQFDALVERIAQNPFQFPEMESGIRHALLRRFPYAVYFLVRAWPVVIAVLHQHRRPDAWKERL